jgi:hypothetical protein
MCPNLFTNYVGVMTGGICPMAVIADIMSVKVLLIRGDIKIISFILSDKIIYIKRLCSRILEIK